MLRLHGLEPEVRAMLERGELEMGHVRALLAIAGPAQTKLAKEVTRKSLSVRQTEELVRRQATNDTRETTRERDPDLLRLEQSLERETRLQSSNPAHRQRQGENW